MFTKATHGKIYIKVYVHCYLWIPKVTNSMLVTTSGYHNVLGGVLNMACWPTVSRLLVASSWFLVVGNMTSGFECSVCACPPSFLQHENLVSLIWLAVYAGFPSVTTNWCQVVYFYTTS